MKSGSWKKAENRFARDVGTMRKPCDGSRDGKDFEAGMFGYQLKFRKRFPSMWWEWLSGIVGKCAETHQIGVLVLNRPHHDRKEALVVLRWEDWVALHGEPQIGSGNQASPENAVAPRRSAAHKSEPSLVDRADTETRLNYATVVERATYWGDTYRHDAPTAMRMLMLEWPPDALNRIGCVEGVTERSESSGSLQSASAETPSLDPRAAVTTETLPIWWWGRSKSKERHAAFVPSVAELFDHLGRNRCTVWSNGIWHTWDEHGVGGENDTAPSVTAAKEQATMAVIRQGWAQLVGSATVSSDAKRTGDRAGAQRPNEFP